MEVSSDSTNRKGSALNRLRHLCEYRFFNKRGATIVLVWNFFISMTYFFINANDSQIFDTVETLLESNRNYIGLVLISMGVFYPLAGWLADVHFGRYKTLRYSGWIMWVGILLTTILVIIAKFHENTEKIISQVITLSYFIIIVGLCGYQANIIQFGVDQIIDASSQEVKAFLNWYVWTLLCSGFCYTLLSQCIPESYNIFKLLYTATSLTCAILTDILFNNYFTKEPVTINPVKLVLKVLRYAMKTKQPQRRSAFTYWEDKLPSRIDFGKSKYGGPFTNEQVEDVKSFLRMCFTLSVGSLFIGAMVITYLAYDRMMFHLKDTNMNYKSFQNCIERRIIRSAYYNCFVVIIPLYELIIYPLFHKYLRNNILILKKVLFGMILLLITVSILMTMDIAGHTITIFKSPNTTNISCVLQAKEENLSNRHTLYISYKWLIIPGLTLGWATYTSIIGGVEFVCAQSPYSMKGMMFGFLYFAYGLSTVITLGIFYPLLYFDIHWTWLGCGLWFYLLVMVTIAVAIIVFAFVIKWYKLRDRDDELPNTQTFAINYYERYAGQSHT